MEVSEEAKRKLNEDDLERIWNYHHLNIEDEWRLDSIYLNPPEWRWMWSVYDYDSKGRKSIKAVFPISASAEWILNDLNRRRKPNKDVLWAMILEAEKEQRRLEKGDLTDRQMAHIEDVTRNVINDSHWKRPRVFEMKEGGTNGVPV